MGNLSEICQQLQGLQRQRVGLMGSGLALSNHLRANVANIGGYHAGLEESDRKTRHLEAQKIIDSVLAGETSGISGDVIGLITAIGHSIKYFEKLLKPIEKKQLQLAKLLPAVAWVNHPDQRGFGLSLLAQIVGECGDLNNYANPGKLWRRMGCAPYESRKHNRMPSTWRSAKPSLSADEWEDCGYCPRRRALAFLVGECMVKLNQGPYRARYDQAKANAVAKHPEWAGKKDPAKGLHYNFHGNLLTAKLLLKNLWIVWTGGEKQRETDEATAAGLLDPVTA